MKLTVVTCITGFDPLRTKGLNKLIESLQKQTFKEFEVIIVEQAQNPLMYHKFEDNLFSNFQHIKLPYQSKGFNKAWCMNVAVNHSNTELLCFMDADMRFDEHYLEKAYEFKQKEKHRFFLGWEVLIKEEGRDEKHDRTIYSQVIKTAGGIFWIDKYFWWEAGGMCEEFFGYGGEDNDFWQRANVCLGGDWKHCWVHRFPYTIYHTYHHDAPVTSERLHILNITAEQPHEVIKKLKKHNLGKIEGPVDANVKAIKLKKNPTYVDSGRHQGLK
jgi:glycosyltransferase involved in cell wall biosynthesis